MPVELMESIGGANPTSSSADRLRRRRRAAEPPKSVPSFEEV